MPELEPEPDPRAHAVLNIIRYCGVGRVVRVGFGLDVVNPVVVELCVCHLLRITGSNLLRSDRDDKGKERVFIQEIALCSKLRPSPQQA